MVKISGLTKQDCITQCLLANSVIIHGNPSVYRAKRSVKAADSWSSLAFRAFRYLLAFSLPSATVVVNRQVHSGQLHQIEKAIYYFNYERLVRKLK